MLAELRGLCESFTAFFTEEWPFTRMSANMIVQRRRSSKCARAVTALKWLVISMSYNMRAQFIG